MGTNSYGKCRLDIISTGAIEMKILKLSFLICVLMLTAHGAGAHQAETTKFDWGGRSIPEFTPPKDAVLIDTPGTLDKEGAYYFLTKDIVADQTAFQITKGNITLDLGGHTVIYNAGPSKDKCYGVHVKPFASHATIKNGYVIQGQGKSKESPAIFFQGDVAHPLSHQDIHHLIIRTNGTLCAGILGTNAKGFLDSQIHQNYIENFSQVDPDPSVGDGTGGDCIIISAKSVGGFKISENVLAAGHRGIHMVNAAPGDKKPARSEIKGNLIQHSFREGYRNSFGIYMDKIHNTDVRGNQIVTDNGRGIILDGFNIFWDEKEGSRGNSVYDNIIDVEFSRLSR
ncbi:hypothetical protein LCGC14_2825070, partial [marine sediment metagenome]